MDGAGDRVCVVRGGGDLGTGVVWRLTRAGFDVLVLELEHPLTVRRTVAMSTAITDGIVDVEGMVGRRVDSLDAAADVMGEGDVAVMVSSELPPGAGAPVVIDARLAKRNIDTSIDDAPLVIGVGPGFTAGVDCHAAVETMRGHHLGRVMWHGSPAPNTGVPGEVGGESAQRVLRAPAAGSVRWVRDIGDRVDAGELLGEVGAAELRAQIGGVVRGLIAEATVVETGLKIGDVDPRAEPAYCYEISDKALAVGGGVLEAVMTWMARSS